MFFARIIGHTVDRVIFKNERGHGLGFYIATFVAEMVLAVLASMIVMAFSRYREYRADAAGARLADRQSMIGALNRLLAEQHVVLPINDSGHQSWIDDPLNEHLLHLHDILYNAKTPSRSCWLIPPTPFLQQMLQYKNPSHARARF